MFDSDYVRTHPRFTNCGTHIIRILQSSSIIYHVTTELMVCRTITTIRTRCVHHLLISKQISESDAPLRSLLSSAGARSLGMGTPVQHARKWCCKDAFDCLRSLASLDSMAQARPWLRQAAVGCSTCALHPHTASGLGTARGGRWGSVGWRTGSRGGRWGSVGWRTGQDLLMNR